MKILIVFSSLALLTFLILLINNRFNQSKTENSDKIQVSTSFYPLAFFAQSVGGDLVQTESITPSGTEPHEFEPRAKDITKILNAKLFIYNGLGFDLWADRIKEEVLVNRGQVLKMSDHLENLNNDPHFWLSFSLAEQQVDLIKEALIQIDPTNSQIYEKNANELMDNLRELDSQYRQNLSNCELREFVTSHNSFGYLAKDYNLSQISLAGFSPEDELSVQKIAEVSRLVKEKNIPIIFFEQLVSPKLSATIAQEAGAKILVLNPIEGLTSQKNQEGENYFTLMRSNLNNLKQALKCQ